MINLKYFQNEKKIFNFYVLTSFIISLIFYFQTYDFPWTGDDFYLIFLQKLFNLINNNSFFIDDGSYVAGLEYARFVPLYGIIYQFLTPNYSFFNLLVISLHFLNSIIFFLISIKLFKNNFVSFLSSFLFLIHYSITIKALTWAAFCGHIFNCFFGLISIYFFLKYLEYRKIHLIIISTIFATLGPMIMESGLIYPILNFLFIYFFKSRKISDLTLSIFPIFLYFFISFFLFQNSAFNFFFNRAIKENSHNEFVIKQKEVLNTIYFYRSTYSPRNAKGYAIRIVDNILNSINISSLEHTILSNKDNNLQKNFIKKNYKILIILFMFLFLSFIFLLFLILRKSKFLKKYIKLIFIYLVILFIYSILFHRKDLSIALSFPTTLIIAIACYDLIKVNYKKLAILIISIFTIPSLIYFYTKFDIIEDLGSWKQKKEIYNLYQNEILKDANIVNFDLYGSNLTYFYYYNNYEKYKNYLKKYENLSFKEFRNFHYMR